MLVKISIKSSVTPYKRVPLKWGERERGGGPGLTGGDQDHQNSRQ